MIAEVRIMAALRLRCDRHPNDGGRSDRVQPPLAATSGPSRGRGSDSSTAALAADLLCTCRSSVRRALSSWGGVRRATSSDARDDPRRGRRRRVKVRTAARRLDLVQNVAIPGRTRASTQRSRDMVPGLSTSSKYSTRCVPCSQLRWSRSTPVLARSGRRALFGHEHWFVQNRA